MYLVEIRREVVLAICAVLLAAARFPEEQAKVQAELDAVIGRHQGSFDSLLQCYRSISFASKHQHSPTKNPFLACKHSSLRL
jgi:hypothetical protein